MLEKLSNAPHHFTSARAIVYDSLEGDFRFPKIRRIVSQPTKRCICVGNDCGKWLINFMSNRPGKLAHGREPRYPRKFCMSLLHGSVCVHTFGFVDRDTNVFNHLSRFFENWSSDAMEVFDSPVTQHGTIKKVIRLSLLDGSRTFLGQGSPIVRMDQFQEHIVRWLRIRRVDAKYAALPWRPELLAGPDISCPATSVAQFFGLCEIRRGPPQFMDELLEA